MEQQRVHGLGPVWVVPARGADTCVIMLTERQAAERVDSTSTSLSCDLGRQRRSYQLAQVDAQ